MCGRFILTSPVESIGRLFGFPERPNLAPRYNIAPTQQVAAVRLEAEDGARHLALLRWGLVPFWAKDAGIGARMINARAESIAGKPAFKAAFRRRRCLIPANGFYEWQKREGGIKQPFLIQREDGGPFAFAGLWESWTDKASGAELESCSIVTTGANDLLRPVHHRMPVILEDDESQDRWLAREAEQAALLDLLRPAGTAGWRALPVSTRVNKVANDDPSLLQPLQEGGGRDGGEGGDEPPPTQGQLF